MKKQQAAPAPPPTSNFPFEKANKDPVNVYEEYFGLMNIDPEGDIKQIQKILQNADIKYDPEKYQKQIKIKILEHSLNFKIMLLYVELGHFQFEVSIINEPNMSRAHLMEHYVFRNSEYYVSFEEPNDFAVKCFKIKEENTIEQLAFIIREYCFYRIAGCLRVGPGLLKPWGFDIIICSQCIQFAMEECIPIHKSPDFWNQEVENELKNKLKLWHRLHMVHSNIHPQNIIWLESQKEPFLSDFCYSRCIDSPLGQKVKTEVVGNINFSCDDMIKIFDGQQTQAELFVNDIIGLEKSFDFIRKQNHEASKKKLTKGSWNIDLGNLFGQYRALYHNLSRVQPKVDTAYAFMYEYFHLMKFLQQIHVNNQNILTNPDLKKLVEKNEVKLFKMGNQYYPTHFLSELIQYVKITILENNKRNIEQKENVILQRAKQKREKEEAKQKKWEERQRKYAERAEREERQEKQRAQKTQAEKHNFQPPPEADRGSIQNGLNTSNITQNERSRTQTEQRRETQTQGPIRTQDQNSDFRSQIFSDSTQSDLDSSQDSSEDYIEPLTAGGQIMQMIELIYESQWQKEGSFFGKMKIDYPSLLKQIDALDEFDLQQKIGLEMQKKLTYDKPIKSTQDRRAIVQHSNVITKIRKETYYSDLIHFIQLRQMNSTFHQKSKACRLFNQIFKVPPIAQQMIRPDYVEFEACLKHILYDMIENPILQYETIIPDVIVNLVILDVISPADLAGAIRRLNSIKQDPTKNVIMLFKTYLALDYVTYKTLTLFEHSNVVELARKSIYAGLQALKGEADQQILNLVVLLLTSDTQATKVTEDQVPFFIKKIKKWLKNGKIDEKTSNQLVQIVCFNSTFLSASTISQQKYQQMLKTLYAFNPRLEEQCRVDSFHLRLFIYLAYHEIGYEDRFEITNNFRKCVQIPGLIVKYKMYYIEEKQNWTQEEVPQTIKGIQDLIRRDHYRKSIPQPPLDKQKQQKYKFNRDVLFEVQYYMRFLNDKKDYHDLVEFYLTKKLRNYYKKQHIEHISFPIDSEIDNFISFYESAYAIINLYILIYNQSNEKRDCFNIVHDFLELLENNKDALRFEGSDQIKAVLVHFVNFIQIQKNRINQKPEEGLSVCKNGMEQVLSSQFLTYTKKRLFLMHYIDHILKIVFTNTSIDAKKRQELIAESFNTLMRFKLYRFLITHHFGFKFIWFINIYLIFLEPDLDTFFRVHSKMLRILEEDPKQSLVQRYSDSLKEFFTAFKQQLQAIARDLTLELLKVYVKKNKYFRIMLSYLIPFYKLDSVPLEKLPQILDEKQKEKELQKEQLKPFNQIKKSLLSRFSSLSSTAQDILLNNIFSHILMEYISTDKKFSKRKTKQIRLQFIRYTKWIMNQEIVDGLIQKQQSFKMFKKKKNNEYMRKIDEKRRNWEKYNEKPPPEEQSSDDQI